MIARWRRAWNKGDWRSRLSWLAGWLVVLDVALVALGLGLRWREAMFAETVPLRFRGDISNGLRQGNAVVELARRLALEQGHDGKTPTYGQMYRAWVQRYDQLVEDQGEEGRYQLDYTPARLAVMSLWVRAVQREFPDARSYNDAYTAPLLHFNTACELLAALGIFLLVRHWLRRAQTAPPRGGWRWPWSRGRDGDALAARLDPAPIRQPWKANAGALLAATLMWFNPTVVVNAHAWPQWDVWALPFYVWAVYFATVGGWVASGAMIGLGAMFKGQILFAAPVLLIWPLVAGRWDRALRLIAGGLLGAALVVWPWLVRTSEAYFFLIGLLVSAALLTPWYFPRARRWPWWVFAVVGTVALALIVWPWTSGEHRRALWQPAILALIVFVGPWIVRRRAIASWIGVILAAGIVLVAVRFESSASWYYVGFDYPQRHYQALIMGTTDNLAAILGSHYGWKWTDEVTIPAKALWLWPAQPTQILLRNLMKWIFGATLVLCGIGAARQARRNDPRFLVAVVAPWLLSFALLPQMHERYMLWATALAAACVVVSVGMFLLYLLTIVLSFMMMFHTMLGSSFRTRPVFDWRATLDLMTWHLIPNDPAIGTDAQTLIEATRPGIGWLVILLALVYLYVALSSGPRRRTLADQLDK